MKLGTLIINSPHTSPSTYEVHGRNQKAKKVELWKNGKKPEFPFVVDFPITHKGMNLAPSQEIQYEPSKWPGKY